MTVGKTRIWTEENLGPAWSRIPSRRIWRFKVPRGNGYIHGITPVVARRHGGNTAAPRGGPVSKPSQPVTLGVKIGALLLAAGLIAWLFLGDWRYAVAGVLALLVSAVVGLPTERKTP